MPGSFRKRVWCIGYSSAFKNSAGLFVKNKITCSASQKDEFSSNDEEREKNVPLVKMCRIPSARDAAMAAEANLLE